MRTYQRITANSTGKHRYEVLDGRKYIVTSAVIMKEGVWEGSDGPLFYPGAKLSKVVPAMNNKPTTHNHPKKDGEDCSAADASILRSCGLGIVLNTSYVEESKKQKTEVWVDVKKANKLDSTLVSDIEKGKKIEVSTGLYVETDETPGKYKGKDYIAKVIDIQPDHLAILRNGSPGAFGVKDGGGLNTNQKRVKNTATMGSGPKAKPKMRQSSSGMSHQELHQKLHKAIRSKARASSTGGYDYTAVHDVYPNFVVYSHGWNPDGDAKHFKHDYKMRKGEPCLTGEPSEVNRVVRYKDAASGDYVTNQKKENPPVTKKEKYINTLIKNGVFQEQHRPLLESLDRDKLRGLLPKELQSVTSIEDLIEKHTKKAVVENQAKKPTFNELFETADDEMKQSIIEGQKAYKTMKDELIKNITANSKCPYTKEELQAIKDIDSLKKIAILAGVETKKPALFIGNAGSQDDLTTNAEDDPQVKAMLTSCEVPAKTA